jgi:hypothetical protein
MGATTSAGGTRPTTGRSSRPRDRSRSSARTVSAALTTRRATRSTNLHRPESLHLRLSPLDRWNERNPLNYVDRLAHLPFPIRLYWSSHDTVVGNQATNQTGKLYKQIKAKNRSADVKQVKGLWAHSCEFVPGDRLSDALRDFELIA